MHCYNTSCAVPTTGAVASTFASAIQFFAAAQCCASEGIYPEANVKNGDIFDFIIVGAGSAGCVLANRLSEVKHWNILLIEAGGDPPIEANIPGFHLSFYESEYSWGYYTTNDGIVDQGYINGSIEWPRGKMIGGCSNINGLIYIQGNSHDFQRWHDAGNKEWSVKEIRRCFRKAESYQNKDLDKNPAIHKHYGHCGPLVVNTFNSTYRKNTEDVLSAWKEIGIKTVLDLNAANSMGAGITPVTASNGERNSVSKSYLRPIKRRKNLKIMKHALVTKILINSSKRAYGVIVKSKHRLLTIHASKEIIISAGTINSPQLLMLSGIGPIKHLKSKNIEPVIDLPMVGQNLIDHTIITIPIYTREPREFTEADHKFDVIQYFYKRKGYLAQHGVHDISAFFSLDKKAKHPDFEIYLFKYPKNAADLRGYLKNTNRYADVITDYMVGLNKKYTLYNFVIALLHPYSNGNISLHSNNPEDQPLIYPKYFSDRRDLELTVSGILEMVKVVDTTFFKSVKGFLGRIKWPECDKFGMKSRDYWRCICVNLAGTVYHPVRTCKMGSNSRNSVVSSRLKVHGIKDLRVVDASIMPNHLSANMNAPTVMIGERGAELIKEDHGL